MIKLVRKIEVVAVEETQQLRPRRHDPGIARGIASAVAVELHQDHPRVGILGDDRGRPVGRAIVHHHQLEIREPLGQNAVDGLAD